MSLSRNLKSLIGLVKPRIGGFYLKSPQVLTFITFVESSKRGKNSILHVDKLLDNNQRWVEARVKKVSPSV